MDINLLALNLGTSRLAIGSFAAGELGEVTRVSHNKRADWPALIEKEWSRIAKREGAAVVASSVNPALEEPLEQAVGDVSGRRILWVGKDIDPPIKVLTDETNK